MEGVFSFMNITDYICSLDPSLTIHNEGEWSHTHSNYSAFNDAGVEIETGEFLYSLIRILKPSNVLETGTHWGIGSSYMGMALKDNGSGHLDTVEFIPEIYNVALKRIIKLGLAENVQCHLMDVANFEPNKVYQFVLLDTEPQTRFAEFVKFYEFVAPGGFIFIHDLHRHMHQIDVPQHDFAWPYGPVPFEMKRLYANGQIRPIHFSTPRGLTGFYKVHPEDYKW